MITAAEPVVPQERLDVQVRWLIRRDIPAVLAIEEMCHEFPWTLHELLAALRYRDVVAMVAEHNEQIVGFMIYELRSDYFRLTNLSVHPAYQSRGVGSALVQKLKRKLGPGGRMSIGCEVRESNLEALNFLKKQGFKAMEIVRNFWTQTDDDAYFMRFGFREIDCGHE